MKSVTLAIASSRASLSSAPGARTAAVSSPSAGRFPTPSSGAVAPGRLDRRNDFDLTAVDGGAAGVLDGLGQIRGEDSTEEAAVRTGGGADGDNVLKWSNKKGAPDTPIARRRLVSQAKQAQRCFW